MVNVETNGSNGSGRETAVLVCGLCREILPGRYAGKGKADLAADDHVQEEHPERSSVLVIPVSEELAKDRRAAVVAIAAQAQAGFEEDIGMTAGGHCRGSEAGTGEAV